MSDNKVASTNITNNQESSLPIKTEEIQQHLFTGMSQVNIPQKESPKVEVSYDQNFVNQVAISSHVKHDGGGETSNFDRVQLNNTTNVPGHLFTISYTNFPKDKNWYYIDPKTGEKQIIYKMDYSFSNLEAFGSNGSLSVFASTTYSNTEGNYGFQPMITPLMMNNIKAIHEDIILYTKDKNSNLVQLKVDPNDDWIHCIWAAASQSSDLIGTTADDGLGIKLQPGQTAFTGASVPVINDNGILYVSKMSSSDVSDLKNGLILTGVLNNGIDWRSVSHNNKATAVSVEQNFLGEPGSKYKQTKTFQRIINYVDENGNSIAPSVTQSVVWTRLGDNLNNMKPWLLGSDSNLAAVKSPDVNGYTNPSISTVSALQVTGDEKQNAIVNVVYKSEKGQASYQFIDDTESGKNIGNVVTLTGKIGDTINTNLQVPTNYQLANGQSLPSSVTIQNNAGVIKIHLVHVTQSVNDSKTINRTINVTDPNGKVTTTKQSATINRQGTKDLVTNQITWNNWSMALLPEYDVPKPDGYHASQDKVTSQQVTAASQDSTVNISYVANAQSINILYKDGNKVVKTVPLTGKTGDTVDVNIAIPEHYHVTNQVVKNYTFKASENPDIVVELGHDTQIVSDSKTVTRTINVTDPNGKVTTTKQSVTINRQGIKDLVTNQITWNDWSSAALPEYNVPTIPGYQATRSKVDTQPVTTDSQNSVINITYTANGQAANVVYKDGNQIIKTVPLTGKTGETVKVPIDVPTSYHLTNQPVGSYTFKANDNPDIVVELEHDTQLTDDSQVITRVIKITHPDGQVATEIQKATVTRTGSKDVVTGKITWKNWSTAKWDQYNATKIPGYTSTMPVVSEQAVTSDTPDTTIEIKYVANSQQTNLIYKDGNKVVKMTTLNGKTDETVDVKLDVPEHYHVINQVAKTYTFKADHNDDVIVELGHDVQKVSGSHTINRTINLISPDGTKKAIKQSASINRMGAKDSVTGNITWSDWSDAQLPEYEVPVLDGYTASQSKVAAEKVTSDTQDSTVNITYAANQQSVNIICKDGNQVVKTAVLTGKTDETVKVPVELPANYHVDGKTPTDYTFKAKDNQDIVINLGHDTQTVTQSKTVKRTIKLELPGETNKPVVQQVTFTRHGIKDLVTGKTTWGSWDHNGKYQFDSYTPQNIAGYEVTPDKVDSLLVTPESKDSEVTISYHKLVTKPTVKPQTPQKPAAYAPKVRISQVSQPVVATQSMREPQQKLPQTGNNNEAALATGFMGLLLAIGSLGFGKKYRI